LTWAFFFDRVVGMERRRVMGRPRGVLGSRPYGRLTLMILRQFDGWEGVGVPQLAEELGTSRQMVHKVLARWRPLEYARMREVWRG